MQLASDKRKIQVHDHPLFSCSAYYTDWRKSFIEGVQWHWHDEIEFAVVVDGEADAEFGEVRPHLKTGWGNFRECWSPPQNQHVRLRNMSGAFICS